MLPKKSLGQHFLIDNNISNDKVDDLIKDLESRMKMASRNLNFEEALLLRDQIIEIRKNID